MKFSASKYELTVISSIADRAVSMAKEINVPYNKSTALMDIEAVHSNGNPLDLDKLLNADNFNFAHDVFGIRSHLNRETGELMDCFSPRYSLQYHHKV